VLELYTPHSKQREIHNAINSGNQKYYIVSIGRQFGEEDSLAKHYLQKIKRYIGPLITKAVK
jgi:hypothetical protein